MEYNTINTSVSILNSTLNNTKITNDRQQIQKYGQHTRNYLSYKTIKYFIVKTKFKTNS